MQSIVLLTPFCFYIRSVTVAECVRQFSKLGLQPQPGAYPRGGPVDTIPSIGHLHTFLAHPASGRVCERPDRTGSSWVVVSRGIKNPQTGF